MCYSLLVLLSIVGIVVVDGRYRVKDGRRFSSVAVDSRRDMNGLTSGISALRGFCCYVDAGEKLYLAVDHTRIHRYTRAYMGDTYTQSKHTHTGFERTSVLTSRTKSSKEIPLSPFFGLFRGDWFVKCV